MKEYPEGPEVKLCKRCSVPCTRSPNQKNKSWGITKYCKPCREKVHGKASRAEPRLGLYEVKNATIDSFLSGVPLRYNGKFRIKVCAKSHPWVGKTTINRCKSGRVKDGG